MIKKKTIQIILFTSATICFVFYASEFAFSNPNKTIQQNETIQIKPKDSTIPEKKLKSEKLEVEIEKLRAEVNQLRISNKANGPLLKRIINILSAIGGIAGAVVAFLIWMLSRSFTNKLSKFQAEKLKQDKRISREEHLLNLYKTLSDKSLTTQIAAAAVLLQRLHEGNERKKISGINPSQKEEQSTIINVLLAIIKKPEIKKSPESKILCKFIGDKLAIALDATGKKIEDLKENSPLKRMDLDFQNAYLPKVWWPGIDAREVDFFEADLNNSGFSGAFLMKAVFKNSILENCVFKNANLSEVNFCNANLIGANLSNANLSKANLYNANLSGANLSNAILTGADLRNANLENANMHGAQLLNTKL